MMKGVSAKLESGPFPTGTREAVRPVFLLGVPEISFW